MEATKTREAICTFHLDKVHIKDGPEIIRPLGARMEEGRLTITAQVLTDDMEHMRLRTTYKMTLIFKGRSAEGEDDLRNLVMSGSGCYKGFGFNQQNGSNSLTTFDLVFEDVSLEWTVEDPKAPEEN